ncbi:MAG TPA: hypothetical protein VHQ90_18955 [Thermoanaerobaculia bacterium]|nr:hypothetical protein [Thermoanaerobaculia bacterium]
MALRAYRLLVLVAPLAAALPRAADAQERSYFVTYNHQMEQPGNLEVAINPVAATRRGGAGFAASWMELEYGVKAWWTTELYFDGQTTRGDSTISTGWRWESRFRPLMLEHRINPVIYVEYADITAADKTMLEVVGHDVESDHAQRNGLARRLRQREIETKLILSSRLQAWDVSENFIAEKNLAGPPWEFGYAVGASRPLGLAARPDPCTLCPENFVAGVEIYGGLGDGRGFGLRETSHYLAPLLSWGLPGGTTLRLSPTFGLNRNSHRFLLRFGASYEISDLRRQVRRLWGAGGR